MFGGLSIVINNLYVSVSCCHASRLDDTSNITTSISSARYMASRDNDTHDKTYNQSVPNNETNLHQLFGPMRDDNTRAQPLRDTTNIPSHTNNNTNKTAQRVPLAHTPVVPPLPPCPEGILRFIHINTGGICSTKKLAEFKLLLTNISQSQADIYSVNEVNLDTTQAQIKRTYMI